MAGLASMGGWTRRVALLAILASAAPSRAEPWRLALAPQDEGSTCMVERSDPNFAAVSADGASFALLSYGEDTLDLRLVPMDGRRPRVIRLVGPRDCADYPPRRIPASLPRRVRAANEALERGGYVSVPSLPRLNPPPSGSPPVTNPAHAVGNQVGAGDVKVVVASDSGLLWVEYRGRTLLNRHLPTVRVKHANPYCRVRVPQSVTAWRAGRWLLMEVHHSGGHGCEPNTPSVVQPPFLLPRESAPRPPAHAPPAQRPLALNSHLQLSVFSVVGGQHLGDLPAAGAGLSFPPGESWALAPHTCRVLHPAYVQALALEVTRLHAPALDLRACGQDGSSGLAALHGTGLKELALRAQPPRPDGRRLHEDVNLQSLRGMRGLHTVEVVGTLSQLGLWGLAHLPDMKRLRLRGASLTRDELSALGPLYQLTAFELHDSVITPEDGPFLFPLPRNTPELHLSRTQMAKRDFASIAHRDQLRSLTLRDLGLTAQELRQVAKLRWLRTLVLDDAVGDSDLGALCGLELLVSLTVRSPRLGDDGVKRLQCLPLLRELHLDGPAITDAGLVAVARLPSLAALTLCSTRVTDAGRARLRAARPGLRVTDCAAAAAARP